MGIKIDFTPGPLSQTAKKIPLKKGFLKLVELALCHSRHA